jgi:hypothetical protein
MGFRFRRSFRLLPGIRLNLSKGGISVSLGVRGASMTVGRRGTTTSVGLSGTGLSYTSRIPFKGGERRPDEDVGTPPLRATEEPCGNQPSIWSTAWISQHSLCSASSCSSFCSGQSGDDERHASAISKFCRERHETAAAFHVTRRERPVMRREASSPAVAQPIWIAVR